MKRGAPKLAIAWTDGVYPRRYVSQRSAYYAIAKRLVVEKYPPWLSSEDGATAYAESEGWTDALVERRTAKMFELFYRFGSGGEPIHFDDRRWKRFVLRVARFLVFVDSKRTAEELLELRFGGLLPAESIALAEAEYQSCERASVQLAERARDIKAYIAERSRR